MGFTISKVTFDFNVFSKIFDFRALGLHKLFVRDKHICYSFLCTKKVCKEKVSDGHIIFGVGAKSFLDKLRSTVSSMTFIFIDV